MQLSLVSLVNCCSLRCSLSPVVNILHACREPYILPVSLPIIPGYLRVPSNRIGWWIYRNLLGSVSSSKDSWRNDDSRSQWEASYPCAAASASDSLIASRSATGDDMESGSKCSCGRCRSPRRLHLVLRDIGIPLESVLVLRIILTGMSLVPGGTWCLGMYVMVPRSSRVSSSWFQERSHSIASGAFLASLSVFGDVMGTGGVIMVVWWAWCAICICGVVASGSFWGSYILKSDVRQLDIAFVAGSYT